MAGTKRIGKAKASTGGGSGTVTNVSSANGYISVANPTTTPVLTFNSSLLQTNGIGVTTAKVSLSAAQIKNIFTTPVVVPEFAAVAGKIWNIISVVINYTFGTVDFLNVLQFEPIGSPNAQWRCALTGLPSIITGGTDSRDGTNCFAINTGLQVHADSDSVTGDGSAIVYITAYLITA